MDKTLKFIFIDYSPVKRAGMGFKIPVNLKSKLN